jgi:hypothetical protein
LINDYSSVAQRQRGALLMPSDIRILPVERATLPVMGTRIVENPAWREDVEEWTRRSCEAQGVPVKITDPVVLRKVAVLLGAKP